MLTLIEASNYRSLKYCRQPLQDSHLLLGPNASGKSTFMDVIAFVRDLVKEGEGNLIQAVEKRTSNPCDLLWNREGNEFGFALECALPPDMVDQWKTLRYELTVGVTGSPFIKKEVLDFVKEDAEKRAQLRTQLTIFPGENISSKSIHEGPKNKQRIITKSRGNKTHYYPEARKGFKPYINSEDIQSGLSTIPDPENFPAAEWFRQFLQKGILNLALHSAAMRSTSPPTHSHKRLMSHGDNLPRVIEHLKNKDVARFNSWLKHIRTGLPEIKGVDIEEREEDRHKYLVVVYESGLKVPAWLVSDGTLRMLALTLLPYCLPEDSFGVYLLEEPENGVHPKVMDVITSSLRSISRGQILIASHSPVMLNLWREDLGKILCFSKNSQGASDIVAGDNHPRLKEYLTSGQDGLPLEHLYCSGVLD